ncbi:MAG TPA: hypothetical protein PLG47_05855 [Candidatus Dojkabacteria bacterium]|nr:hypothetical protein [Candidatus Dojkabacteria bacterium]
MANTIDIYQNNSKTIIATVSGLTSLSGYTGILTAKKNIADTSVIFSSTGTTDGFTITFELLPTQTNIASGIYHYDIVVSNGTKNYTLVQSQIKILDSVKY